MTQQHISGTVNVDDYTVYSDDLLADDVIFDVGSAATLVFTGDDAFNVATFNGPGEIRSLRSAVFDGTVAVDDAPFVNVGAVSQNGAFRFSSLVRNVGSWAVGDDDQLIATGPGARFVNVGALAATDMTVVSTFFIDYGSVDYSGALFFSGCNALINVQGLPRGVIVFTGADQRLTLNDVAAFQGDVYGFDASGDGDTITVDTSVWSFAGFTGNTGGNGGVLEFVSDGAEVGVTLTGAYAALGFHAAASGDKTTITYSAPA